MKKSMLSLLLMLSFTLSAHAEQVLSPIAILPSVAVMQPATQEDIPTLTDDATQGNAAAQTRLGWWYVSNQEADRGKEWLQKAANTGYPEAQYRYALALRAGELDFTQETIIWLNKAALQNHPQAAATLAQTYAEQASDESRVSMILWLRMAASLGHAESAKKLGWLYFKGQEIEHDGVAAYTWLYLSRHGFSVPAKVSGKDAPLESDGYDNPIKFLNWTLTLEELRQVNAALAAWPKTMPPEASTRKPSERERKREVMDDIPSPPILPKERANLKAKAKAGDNTARVDLGYLYLKGKSVPRDEGKAFSLFKQAANAGDTKGLLALATAYKEGAGIAKNPEKAREIYAQLAKTGDPSAQVHLGKMLLDPPYPDKRDDKTKTTDQYAALVWLEKTAAKGNLWAMHELARHYSNKDDRKQAAFWYERAAQAGSDAAIMARIEIAESDRNHLDLYKWMSIYMSYQEPASRLRMRYGMLLFASGLTNTQMQEQKQAADKWLARYPKAKTRLQERAAKVAEYANGRDREGRTALHHAVLENDGQKIRQLLKEKADPNAVDDTERTPLHMAARTKDMSAAKILLAAGAYIDAQARFNETPLLDAASVGNIAAVKFLLTAGANPALQNSGGETPLHKVMSTEGLESARLLLATGVNRNITDYQGQTPLHIAIQRNQPDMVQLLLASGAKPDMADKEGNTPLHIAVERKQADMVKLLLAAKANPNVQNRFENTPLHLAANKEVTAIAEQLLKAKAKLDIQNKEGETALYIAAKKEHVPMVKTLLAAKANPNLGRTADKNTPLHAAVRGKSTETLALLLKAKANPNEVNKNQETPLHYAVERNKLAMVQLLLNAKANPNVADKQERTPLLLATREKNTDTIKALLDAGAKANVKGGYGNETPLHVAVSNNSLDSVKLLLAAKADPNAKNGNGKTALDVARTPNMIKILQEGGAINNSSAEKSNREIPLFDELGRPMNKAAEEVRNNKARPSEKAVHIVLNSTEEAQVFNETVEQERAGKPSPFLTRAVLMDKPVEELARRITAGADVNGVDPVFGTPLTQAFEQRRSIETIQFLLDKGANPNQGKPLLRALSRGPAEAVSLLIKAGADVMTVDNQQTPALILAVKSGHQPIVESLLKAGVPTDTRDAEGKSALWFALKNAQPEELVRLLLSHGASVEKSALLALSWETKNIGTALLLLEHGASGNIIQKYQGSLLHWAINEGHQELFDAALKASAPLDSRNEDDTTPLLLAVMRGRADFVTALIQAGAPVNASAIRPGAKFVDSYGILYDGKDDILARAVEKGNAEIISVLIAGGVALDNRENSFDQPAPLHKAVKQGQTEIVKTLLAGGANPNVQDRYKRTPLHYAAQKNNMKSLDLLLAAKADPNIKNRDGKTALDEAKDSDIIKTLQKAGGKSGK